MKVICMFCDGLIQETTCDRTDAVSHGICTDCDAKMEDPDDDKFFENWSRMAHEARLRKEASAS